MMAWHIPAKSKTTKSVHPLMILVVFFCCSVLSTPLLPLIAHAADSDLSTTPAECSKLRDTLQTTWQAYKTHYIQDDGRVRDPNANNISTSESQAYGLLRAVWMNDRHTFDHIWEWTNNNLRLSAEKSNHLFAWKWGENASGDWTILEEAAASDADEDIALALILAGQQWPQDAEYFKALWQPLLASIWTDEVIDTRYFGNTFMPGDWAHPDEYWLVNPSYFSPLWYRIFASVDEDHDWESLIDSSYDIVDDVLTKTRTGLPPNWLRLARGKAKNDERVDVFTDPDNHQSDYGYDAIRLYWRFGMDYLITGDERARDALRHSNFLERYWFVRHKLPSPLTIDGIERNLDEILYPSNAIYGATLIHLMTAYPDIGETILNDFILKPLDNETNIWQPEKDYYAQNWLWLGLWSYTGQYCGGPTIKGSLTTKLLQWAKNPSEASVPTSK